MLSTSKLRDRLIEQRTSYLQSLERSKESTNRIRKVFDSITDDKVALVQESVGINLQTIKSIDLERVKTDSHYLHESEKQLHDTINAIRNYLEESLNV